MPRSCPLLLRPPLRDVQHTPPLGFCPTCGGEQYDWDIPVRRRGQVMCLSCAKSTRRKEKRL